MTKQLKDILIFHEQPGFLEKLQSSRTSTIQMAFFSDEKREEVLDIVNDVAKRRDVAVSEYTEKFDGVKLTPDQFRISAEDLKKTHAKIDKKLLSSIRKAITNVKKYQRKKCLNLNY